MNKTLTYYFFFSLLLGSTIYSASYFNIQLPRFVRHYVNDFLIIPIVLISCLYIVRKLKSTTSFRLSLMQVLYTCTLYAVIFEYWLPKFHFRYTADGIDVVLYFLSGLIFYVLQLKAVKNE